MDAVGLADRLAEIARTTTDPETGHLVMEIVHDLMTDAGLWDGEDHEGGGEPPPGDWRNAAPVDCPEYA